MSFFKKWMDSLEKDKVVHFQIGLVFSLGFILVNLLISDQMYLMLGIVFGNCLGYGIEIVQSFSANRCVEASDAWATVSGSTIGFSVFYLSSLFI
tara:strand:+ start:194 stop:478 length:285 start_codon:yes stop_codon:yes gene_type:complete